MKPCGTNYVRLDQASTTWFPKSTAVAFRRSQPGPPQRSAPVQALRVVEGALHVVEHGIHAVLDAESQLRAVLPLPFYKRHPWATAGRIGLARNYLVGASGFIPDRYKAAAVLAVRQGDTSPLIL